MTTIHGILFDKDGTLFDFQATWGGWARSLAFDLTGGDSARAHALANVIGFDIATATFAPDSPVIAHTPDEIAEFLLPHVPDTDLRRLVARLNALAAEAPMAPAVPLLPLLSGLAARGLRLGLATNDAEAAALAHLRSAGIAAHFDFVAGYDSGFGAKPAPGPLLAFADRLGLMPEHVAMVGDSRHDLVAGRAAGMRCVAVLTGIATRDQLAPFADVVLPDIGHLPDWLSTLAETPSAAS